MGGIGWPTRQQVTVVLNPIKSLVGSRRQGTILVENPLQDAMVPVQFRNQAERGQSVNGSFGVDESFHEENFAVEAKSEQAKKDD
jgi:hypothetical protein